MSALQPLLFFVTACTLAGLVARHAPALGLVDAPNARSLHSRVTPRGGGLAFVPLVPVAFLLHPGALGLDGVAHATLWACTLAMALLGLADDRYNLSARLRLALQLALAAVLVLALWPALMPDPVLQDALSLLVFILLVVALGWLTNLYNFMDGINGIAAVEAVSVLAGAALLCLLQDAHATALLLLVLAAAVAGFLPWNFPRAQLFMGDVGSLALGFMIGGLALAGEAGPGPGLWAWGTLLSLFLVDATLTLLRRAWRREDILSAHRSHLYQRLALAAGSHVPVTLGVLLLNLALLPAAAWVEAGGGGGWWRMLLVQAVLGALCIVAGRRWPA